MACIHCGLRQRSDGKGTVDLDTVGGLTCTGDGAESDSPAANRGLRIKLNPDAGNSAFVDSSGLYVPRKSSFNAYNDTHLGGPIADPNFLGGGTPYVSPTVSVTVNNPSAGSPMLIAWQATLDWAVTDSAVDFWMELHTQEAGGGWSPVGSLVLNESNVFSTLTSRLLFTVVAPGTTKQLDAQMVIYTGNVGLYRVSIAAFGGYSD